MWDHLRSGLEPVSAASPALAVATLPLRYQESPQVQTLKGKHFYLVIFVGMTTKDILTYVVFLLFFVCL